MGFSYTVLWTGDHCKRLNRAGDAGKPLRVVFGGSHLSQPSLTRFGVVPGDDLYPIRVEKGLLFILARMTVRQLLTVPEYLTEYLGLPETYAALHVWQLKERLATEHADWGHVPERARPTCPDALATTSARLSVQLSH